jgi:putative addiction module component (TIGR02574 family)
MVAEKLKGMDDLSAEEKWLLLGEIWDDLAGMNFAFPVSEEQKQDIRERWENYLENPNEGVSWDEIKKRIGKR